MTVVSVVIRARETSGVHVYVTCVVWLGEERKYDSYDVLVFFQAEDGIRDKLVTGVQTCALPIFQKNDFFGAQPADEGVVFLNGARLVSTKPARAVERGLGLLTEDRKRTGLCLNLAVAKNLTLANVRALVRCFRLERGRERAAAREYIERLHIRPPDPEKTVARMSGGNQQKVLLARWLFAGSQVFLLDEPTRGVDVAARSEIYRVINKLAEAGAAVVMVS